MRLYRLGTAAHAVWDGAGAAAFGGRWNPIGVAVVYAAGSLALAMLERLVQRRNLGATLLVEAAVAVASTRLYSVISVRAATPSACASRSRRRVTLSPANTPLPGVSRSVNAPSRLSRVAASRSGVPAESV